MWMDGIITLGGTVAAAAKLSQQLVADRYVIIATVVAGSVASIFMQSSFQRPFDAHETKMINLSTLVLGFILPGNIGNAFQITASKVNQLSLMSLERYGELLIASFCFGFMLTHCITRCVIPTLGKMYTKIDFCIH